MSLKPFHIVGIIFLDVIFGQKIVMIIVKQTSYWSKTDFFSSRFPVKKGNNNKFSSQNKVISSKNNVQKWRTGQHEQVLCQIKCREVLLSQANSVVWALSYFDQKIKFEAKIDMFNVYINKSLVWTLQFAESLNLYFFIYESMKKNPQK